MNREKLGHHLLLASLFLLPWQTRLILGRVTIGGGATEYGTLSLYAVELLVLAAAVAWWPIKSRLSTGIAKATLAILAVVLVSAAFGPALVVSLNAILHIACAAVLFFLLTDERIASKQVAIAFVAGLLAPALLGWVQTLTGSSPASTLFGLADRLAERPGDAVVVNRAGLRLLRAYGSFSHPNVFGGFLAVGCVLLFWLKSQKISRRLVTSALVALVATLVITFSRSGWLGLAFGAAAFFLVSLSRRLIKAHEALPEIAAALFVAVTVGFLFHDQLVSRFTPSLPLEARSIEERGSQWSEAAAVMMAYPLFGTGPGSYVFGLAQARPGLPSWAYQPIHNVPALFIVEIGFMGALLVLAFVFSYIPWGAIRRDPLSAGLHAALLVPLLLDHYLWTSWSGLALFAVAGALSLRTMQER
jgi:hypothetical protein